MANDNVTLIRSAYEAYVRGDLETLLELVDEDLEWTFLDPAFEDPEPQVCHGRHELEVALRRQAALGLKAEVEEVMGSGSRVMVVSRIPGIDAVRARKTNDRSYLVVTVGEGRIVALRDCRDREEALAESGLG